LWPLLLWLAARAAGTLQPHQAWLPSSYHNVAGTVADPQVCELCGLLLVICKLPRVLLAGRPGAQTAEGAQTLSLNPWMILERLLVHMQGEIFVLASVLDPERMAS
jgi:hypothetical protein